MEPRFKPLYNLLRQTAETIILPRFNNLEADEIEEKSPGDRVTIADKEAEHHLIAGLKAMGTDALFLGEESTAENPQLLKLVDQIKTPYWVLDPIDGTQNFIEGKTTFCTMIALVQQGLPVLSMIYFPLTDTLFAAELGRGAYRFENGGQGARLRAGQSPELFNMSGALNTHYTDEELTDRLNHLADRVETLKSERCAGVEYSLLAQGQKDFANFHRMLPWDHVPGTLLLNEAGGVVRDVDTNAFYRPNALKGNFMLARDMTAWERLQSVVAR